MGVYCVGIIFPYSLLTPSKCRDEGVEFGLRV